MAIPKVSRAAVNVLSLLLGAVFVPAGLGAQCDTAQAPEVLTRITFQSQLRRYELSGFFPYTMASDSSFPTKYRVETWSGTSNGSYFSCGCHAVNSNMVHTGSWTFAVDAFGDTSTKTAEWKPDACGAGPIRTQTGIKDGLRAQASTWGPPITTQTETTRIADYSQPNPLPPISSCDFAWHYWSSYVTDTLSSPMTVAEAVTRGDNTAPISTGTDSLQYWNDFSPKTWGVAKTLSRTQAITFNAQHVGFRVELPAKECGGKYKLVLKIKDWADTATEPADPTRTLVYPDLIELDKKVPMLWPSATTFKTYADFGLPAVQGRKARLVSVELQSAEPCTSLPAGQATMKLSSVDFALSLGRINADTSAGILALTSPILTADSFTPASLQLTAHPSVTVLREAGALRQISAPETFIDIVTLSPLSYELRAYRPSQAGTPDPVTGLVTFTGSPYQSYNFTGNGSNELTITPSDVPARAATYTYTAATGILSMSQPGADRVETSTLTTSGATTTETRTIHNGASVVASQETRVYTTYAFGRVLTSLVNGAGADARTTTTAYYTTVADTANYGRIQQITEPYGAWVRYTYNAQGRVLTETRRYLNNTGTAAASHRVTTSTYGTLADQDGDGTDEELITRVQTTLGTETGRSYQVTFSAVETYNGQPVRRTLDIVALAQGAAWNAVGNLVTTTRTISSGAYLDKIAATLSADQILTTTSYATDGTTGELTTTTATGTPDATATTVLAGTRTITVTDSLGRLLSETTEDIATATTLDAYVVTTTDDYGRATRLDYTDGTFELRAYSCCGLSSETDRQGVTTSYTYDPLGRTEYVTRQGLTTRYTYDAAGRVLKTFRRGTDSTEMLQLESAYNTAGFLTLSKDALSRPTTYQQTAVVGGGALLVTTAPDGGTVNQTTAANGAVLKIDGTATPWRTYAYTVNTNGTFATTEYLPSVLITETTAWRRTTTDLAGRVKTEDFPGGAANNFFYNGLGQLERQVDPDGVQTLFAYNTLGERTVTALDMDRNGVIDYAGTDRITRTTRTVATRNDNGTPLPVNRVVTEVWSSTGADTPQTLEISETSLDGLRTWQTLGGQTTRTVIVNGTGGARTETTTLADTTSRVRTYQNGRLATETRRDANQAAVTSLTYDYDAHGRLDTVTDLAGRVTTYSYFGDDKIHTVTTPDPDTSRSDAGYEPQTTTYHYDNAGREDLVTQPDGAETNTTYWPTGQVKRTWGGRAYPQAFTYDNQSRLKTLTTWQDYAGQTGAAVTTWNYDTQRGWLNNKRDNANKGASYTYWPSGRLKTRTWQRGSVATYAYNNAGGLSAVTYSDTTPSVAQTYDRLGRPETTTDAAGLLTRSYDPVGFNLTSEIYGGTGSLSGRSLTRGYDSLNRPQSLSTDTGYAVGYGYDSAGRLDTVSQGFHLAKYTFKAGVGTVETLAVKRAGVERARHERTTDALGRTGQAKTLAGGNVVVQRDYTYNAANQRTQVTQEDAREWAFGYDALGQVTSAQKRLADHTTPLPGYSFGYTFDNIGNRTQTVANARTTTYTPDLLNRYTSRQVAGAVDVRGEALADATVTVNTLATTRTGKDFYREITAVNTSAAVNTALVIEAVTADAPPQTITENRSAFLPLTPESFVHDDDGNLTQDGRWVYTWDAENRLVAMETRATVATAFPAIKQRLEFKYDLQGRRIAKLVKQWNVPLANWTTTVDLRFLYDGWNLLTELDALNANAVVRTHGWGLDLSGTMQGAGGVGGLLWTTTPTHTFAATADANGNVVAWINTATAVVSGRADYGAFGEPVMKTGVANTLPFGFSSKYADGETGLLYYGFRYLDASTGRWLNRDFIEEKGGVNLYGMVANNALYYIDILGLKPSTYLLVKCEKARSEYLRYKDLYGKYKKDIFAAGLGVKGNQLSGRPEQLFNSDDLYEDLFDVVVGAAPFSVSAGVGIPNDMRQFAQNIQEGQYVDASIGGIKDVVSTGVDVASAAGSLPRGYSKLPKSLQLAEIAGYATKHIILLSYDYNAYRSYVNEWIDYKSKADAAEIRAEEALSSMKVYAFVYNESGCVECLGHLP